MTKATDKPNRTRPLDRDGDGKDGGSLPGNQTAPMAETPPEDLPLTPTAQDAVDEAARLEAMERETDEANAAVRAAAGWTRDEERLTRKLTDIGASFSDLSTEAVVQSWTDQEAFTAETFADAMMAEGRYTSDDGEEFNADGTPIPLPSILSDWEIDFTIVAEGEQTFDPEQVAAAPGEPTGERTSLEAAIQTLDNAFADAPDLGQPEQGELDPSDRQQVAVRVRELEILTGAARLYRSPEGYSSNYGAPYVDPVVVQGWIAAGLAEDIPSAGNDGGVRATAEARRELAGLKTGAAA